MNITNNQSSKGRYKKFVQFPFLFPEIWSLNYLKQCIFFENCADLSKKSKSFNVIYVHLKDLIILFQKIACFLAVWATVHKILRNKISKNVLICRNSTKFINFKCYDLLNSKSQHISQYHFLKERNENFRCIYT